MPLVKFMRWGEMGFFSEERVALWCKIMCICGHVRPKVGCHPYGFAGGFNHKESRLRD